MKTLGYLILIAILLMWAVTYYESANQRSVAISNVTASADNGFLTRNERDNILKGFTISYFMSPTVEKRHLIPITLGAIVLSAVLIVTGSEFERLRKAMA